MTPERDIQAALSHIPAVDRETWVTCALAIKSELGDQGREVWESWSATADNYKPADAAAVWRSAKTTGGVTIASLFHLAKQHGFDPRSATPPAPPTAEEIEVRRKRQAAEAAKIEGQRLAAAAKALKMWAAGNPADSHPYLEKKGVSSTDTLRQIPAAKAAEILGYVPKSDDEPLTGALLIAPVRIGSGVATLELIDQDGRKSAIAGGQKSGGFWSAVRMPDGDGTGLTLAICEGIATTISAHQATGHPAVAALSCGNLPSVARQMRERYAKARIIVCGEPGGGLRHAEQAAQEIGGLLCCWENGDINDLHQAQGLEAVALLIEGATPPRDDLSTLLTLKTQEKHFQTPHLFDRANTPEISANLLPGYLGEYAGAVSRATQTPPGMAVMMALSVAATCLQKRFEVCPHGGDYREPVNIWTLTALPPASRKTAVISAMTAPLSAWEKTQAEDLEREVKDTKIRRATSQKRIEKLMKKAADTDDLRDREKIIAEITDIENTMPDEVRAPRLWTGDVTPERLQMLLEEHDERMAVLTDEGGIFEVMAGLYSEGRANVDIFLQSHAGRSCRVDRQGRTACLDAPALTFGITIQPSVLEDLAGKKARFRGNGTLARFLFCLPENNIGRRDVRNNESIPEAVKARYIAGISSLLEIEGETRTLMLSAEAREYWLGFAQYVETNQGPGGDFESFQDWTGKLPGAALRIAGLLHVVEHGPNVLTISAPTMERTLDLCTLLIEHAKAAFELMGADQSTGDARAVYEWIMREKLELFSRNEVRRALKGRWTTANRLEQALTELQGRDIISEPESRETAGRSATVYPVNPLLFDEVES